MNTSRYDSWKYAAAESGADDEPPRCQIDGCREEGLNMVGTGYGVRHVCDEHKPGAVRAGGTPGCAAGTECEPP